MSYPFQNAFSAFEQNRQGGVNPMQPRGITPAPVPRGIPVAPTKWPKQNVPGFGTYGSGATPPSQSKPPPSSGGGPGGGPILGPILGKGDLGVLNGVSGQGGGGGGGGGGGFDPSLFKQLAPPQSQSNGGISIGGSSGMNSGGGYMGSSQGSFANQDSGGYMGSGSGSFADTGGSGGGGYNFRRGGAVSMAGGGSVPSFDYGGTMPSDYAGGSPSGPGDYSGGSPSGPGDYSGGGGSTYSPSPGDYSGGNTYGPPPNASGDTGPGQTYGSYAGGGGNDYAGSPQGYTPLDSAVQTVQEVLQSGRDAASGGSYYGGGQDQQPQTPPTSDGGYSNTPMQMAAADNFVPKVISPQSGSGGSWQGPTDRPTGQPAPPLNIGPAIPQGYQPGSFGRKTSDSGGQQVAGNIPTNPGRPVGGYPPINVPLDPTAPFKVSQASGFQGDSQFMARGGTVRRRAI